MKNNLKIPIFFLIISILFLLYIYYQSEFFNNGLRRSYYFKYYLFSFVLIIFSIISFFLNKNINIKIIIILISTTFTLYIVEGFLLISKTEIDIQKIRQSIAKKAKIKFDARTKLEIYNDLKNEDESIVSVIPLATITDNKKNRLVLLSGISKRKTIACNENGYYSIYQSDRHGFNNPDNEWDKQKIEFLLIGDSFTHGSCVNEEDTIGGNIREMTNKQGLLNLGYDGHTPLKEYATLREYLPYINAKRVLWIYYEGNDLRGLNEHLNNKILVNYINNLEFSQKLISKQVEIDLKLTELLENTYLYNRLQTNKIFKFLKLFELRMTIENLLSTNFIVSPEVLNKFQKIIRLSKNFAKQKNAKFYFVYLPTFARYYEKTNKTDNFKNYDDIIKIVKNLDVSIINIHKELFITHNDPVSLFPFKNQGHYTELGYKLVAQTIIKKIYQLEKN